MRLHNYNFKGIADLSNFIDEKICLDKTIFVQVFTGIFDKELLKTILNLIKQKIPTASIVGSSTAGEINSGKLYSESILISFSEFDNAKIKTFYFPKADYDTGVDLAKNIISDDSKLAIIYSEVFTNDLESFLNGFSSINSELILAGGNAGDNYKFESTFIIEDNKILDSGFVFALIDSTSLDVCTNYSLNWTPVGKEMTITKADLNIVYEIDNTPIEKLYTYYLGEETVANIPASAIEFPLVKIENGISIARAMVAKSVDDGIVFAGHFKNGDKVRFAIGNVSEILNKAKELQHNISFQSAEAIYIYSCSVRKLFLDEQLNYEFGLFENVAPTTGFFTYGEIYHQNCSNKLLNITTTLLILSEKKESKNKPSLYRNEVEKHSMLKSLTHLVNTTQNDLDNKIISLNQYQLILDESAIVSKTDLEGNITYVNDSFCEVSGYTRAELLGQKHSIVRHPDMDASVYIDLWNTITDKKSWHGNIMNIKKDGSAYYVKSTILPILDKDGEIIEFIAARTDISELFKKDEIIFKQSFDRLTELYNRNALLEKLVEDEDGNLLILLNIVDFSEINNYFGYDVGDKLLIAFSKFLKELISNVEYFRISGDEFAIMFKTSHELDTMSQIVENIVELIEKKEFVVDDFNITINISVGMAYGNKKNIYRDAHLALKESKEKKINLVFYNLASNLQKKTKDNIKIIEKIKRAVNNNRIVPYYQGIYSNSKKKITKYEVLMRLIDDDGSILSPYWFLEQAKKSKLYKKLTKIIMRKSFEYFSDKEFEFSINFTIEDILSIEIRHEIFRLIEKYKCGNRLTIEIVESEGIENFDEVIMFIASMKQFGCKIAVDDFGTGYSNFEYLTKMDIDILKIDGSLIKDIDTNSLRYLTVETIVEFAKKLGIKTVAEFVDNLEVQAKVEELGIDSTQGFLYSIPSDKI